MADPFLYFERTAAMLTPELCSGSVATSVAACAAAHQVDLLMVESGPGRLADRALALMVQSTTEPAAAEAASVLSGLTLTTGRMQTELCQRRRLALAQVLPAVPAQWPR